MLLLLIICSICVIMPLVVSESEKVKAILCEYDDTPILRLKQQFILRGNVTVQSEPYADEINSLSIEIRKKGNEEFHMFEALDFKNCQAFEVFYCVQEKNTYLIFLNTTTMIEFNQSEWRMNGSYNGFEFRSNAVILPIVKPNVEASLKLNQSYIKCEQDILENEEIVLEGHVRFFGDFDENEMHITIQYLTSSVNYTFYNILFLNHCDASSYFKCTRDGDLNSYRTTLVLNATKDLSESHWRLAGTFKRTDYFSNHVQLPKFLDSSKVLMRLNGQTLSKSNTSFTLQEDEELTLCCITTLSPCLAVITVNQTQFFSNQSCVSHRPIKGDKSTFRFGYIVCEDDKYSQVFPIDVNILQVKDITGEKRVGIILSAVFGAIVFIVLIFSLIYCWRKRKNKKPEELSGQRPRSLPPQAKSLPPENREPHSSRQNTQNKETKGIKESTKKRSQANTLPQDDSSLTLIQIPDTNTESGAQIKEKKQAKAPTKCALEAEIINRPLSSLQNIRYKETVIQESAVKRNAFQPEAEII
ncbi:hypothetical protein Bpfe_001240, partial [Biomphalaria pfeifferi]